jgi:hypothetical protein
MTLQRNDTEEETTDNGRRVSIIVSCRPWLCDWLDVLFGRVWWVVILVEGREEASNGPHSIAEAYSGVRLNWRVYEGGQRPTIHGEGYGAAKRT